LFDFKVGSGVGSRTAYRSRNRIRYPGSESADPDPHQNEADPKHCLHYQYHNVCNILLIFILIHRDGFPYPFYIHIAGSKEYRVWGGDIFKRKKKTKKGRKGKVFGEKWKWEAKT